MEARAADKKMTMKKIHTANGYDFYVGDYDGKKFYNIIPVGQSAPEGGYASKGYIEHIKHVKFPVEAAAKPKYDPNTSYERENLERIAKEWAKFCKDTEKQNPGRHDFRIWMEQNYPRITVLDALKQMAMDAVWGKAEPYRSPSNGEPEHQADHYQKRLSGDKDEKAEKPITAAKTINKWKIAQDKGSGKWQVKAPDGKVMEEFSKSEDAEAWARDNKDHVEAAKIDRLWVVTYPGPKSTLADILFSANVAELQKQFKGGLDPKDVFGMYDNQKEAKGHAESLLSALPGKIEGMMRAKAGEEWEPPKSGAHNYGYLRFEHQPNGDIKVTANPENIDDIKEMLDEEGHAGDDAMYDLLSEPGMGHALGNGYTIVKPEDVGALTDGLLLGDGSYDDQGKVYTGNVWWFADYQVKGFAEELAKGNPITLVYGGFASPTEKPEGIDAQGKRKAKAAGQHDKDLMRRWRSVVEGIDATKEIKEYFSYGTSGEQPYVQMQEIAMWAWKEISPIRKVIQDNILAWEKKLGTTAMRTKAEGEQGREAETMHIAAEGGDKVLIAELVSALEFAAELVSIARRYFPKSVKDSDKFKLENASATIGSALNKAKQTQIAPVAMRTTADSDDEGGNLRTEITDDDALAIIEKIQNTPDMQDSEFHEFVEGLGIEPSAAETFAYGLLYDLLNEGPNPEPKPQMDMVAAGKKKK